MAYISAEERDQQAINYLESVRLLTVELSRAMLSISDNKITDLEESLALQDVLVERLRGIPRQIIGRNCIQTRSTLFVTDAILSGQIANADAELQRANRIYEAVLRNSCHSASLMSSLLGSLKGNFQEASGYRLKYQTWSCQM